MRKYSFFFFSFNLQLNAYGWCCGIYNTSNKERKPCWKNLTSKVLRVRPSLTRSATDSGPTHIGPGQHGLLEGGQKNWFKQKEGAPAGLSR